MRKVVIAGPVATQSGYGHHTREIVSNFIEHRGSEWDIKLISLPWGSTPMTYPIPTDWQLRIIPIPLTFQPDIWVQVSVPNELQPVGKYNIGITAGTEGDLCPKEWIENLNKMQLVIVPSQFTKKVFEDTAKHHNIVLSVKIEVVPEYFDETVYTNKETDTKFSMLDEIKESWAFLSVGHWLQGVIGEDRKNVGGLIHCFFETFKNTKDQPALILKTSGATYSIIDRMEIENKIRQIQDMHSNSKLPNVYIIHGDLSDAEMNAMYNHPKVKAMLSFTKAEGFGRPLLEFSTTGKPIIAPHYSGQADFLKKDFICSLPGGLTPIHSSAQNPFLIKEAKWFTPDYGFAKKMMQEVRKNYKKWCELGKRQRYHVNSTFTKTAVKPIYENLLKLVDSQLTNVPQQVQLQLPKLKKVNEESPKIILPKLKKIEA
jgi:glycosyltransferase involved in cell wall biosynthesis